uniref:Glycosyltransferase 8 domain containing 2 n=1 Tax=Haplochromis burtoni TaxID=8153 RepID=A0A3Q2UVL5_HAPBU
MSDRVSVNRILLVLLVLMVCLLLRSTLPKNAGQVPQEHAAEAHDVVPVVICASEERMGASMATINSIISNTDASVFFYVVTLRDAVRLTRCIFELQKYEPHFVPNMEISGFLPVLLPKIHLDPISYIPSCLKEIKNFVLQLNFVRFYLPLLDILHSRVIYLDDDIIVQGDIRDLFNIKLKPGHAAAFATDCDLPSTHETVRSIGMQTTYMGFLDYRKQEVKDLGINPSDCSFNPGVFVADMNEWKKQKVTKELEKWMEENFRQNIYSSAMAGGVATPPMLIVFHDKYTILDPLWHVRHLGWSPDVHYPENFLQEAHLLHWNGPFKPWNYPAVHLDRWEKWFIPDPSGRFSLERPDDDS